MSDDSKIFGVLCVTSEMENQFPSDVEDYLAFYTDLLLVVYRLNEMGKYLCTRAIAFEKGGDLNVKCRYKEIG